VEDGDNLMLVDTLFDGDAHTIFRYLWTIGRTPGELTHILVTHAHRSQIGGLATLARLSNAMVVCHQHEAKTIAGEIRARIRLRPRRHALNVRYWLLARRDTRRHEPPHVIYTVENEVTVEGLQVLHTPGHTAGHLAFAWEGGRVLFAGDTITTWPSVRDGWSGFHLDEGQHRTSLRRVMDLRPEIVCPAHGDPEHLTHALLAKLDNHPRVDDGA
jgi:glyoxylase-like metal-dependent hydrolase (beta-lactamase superfamily II)